jgi:hypothetical protein
MSLSNSPIPAFPSVPWKAYAESVCAWKDDEYHGPVNSIIAEASTVPDAEFIAHVSKDLKALLATRGKMEALADLDAIRERLHATTGNTWTVQDALQGDSEWWSVFSEDGVDVAGFVNREDAVFTVYARNLIQAILNS